MIPDPNQTAINFTLKGIEGLVRANRRSLAEIAEIERDMAGGGSQEAADNRAAAVILIRAKLASNLAALRISQARCDGRRAARSGGALSLSFRLSFRKVFLFFFPFILDLNP